MIGEQTAKHLADGAALAAPIVTFAASVANVHEVAQIFALIGSGLGGIGAFIYYVWHKRNGK